MPKRVVHQGVPVELDDDVPEELLDVGADSRERPADMDVDAIYAEECKLGGCRP